MHPHHTLLRLRVLGGFLGGTDLEFADGLNCLIGGRGAGKTTALELLRFGLGLMPDAKTHQSRSRTLEALIQANLGGGRVTVEIRTKAGMLYTARRAVNEAAEVLNEKSAHVPVSLQRDQIFSADVFSQNEIEEIASSPAAQLDLLDRFDEQAAGDIARELEQIGKALTRSTDVLVLLDAEIIDLRAKSSEVAVLEERLRGFAATSGPDAEKINAAHTAKATRVRELHLPGAAVASIERALGAVTAVEAAFRASLQEQFNEAILNGANSAILQQLETDVGAFGSVLANSLERVRKAALVADAAIQGSAAALADRHAAQESDYRATIEQSEEEMGKAVERSTVQIALTGAQIAGTELLAKEKQRAESQTERKRFLDRASELRDHRYAVRKRVAERLTNQFKSLRVTVSQAADLEKYRGLLVSLLKGAGVKQGPTAEKLSEVFLPTELAQIVTANDSSAIVERCGFDTDRTRRVLEGLRSRGGAYEIESIDIDDRPTIELRDGEKYKESAHLSTGQRCTTILPILLVQSERPLLIDQPEDNLDNAFVYDTIVAALRAIKGSRQVVFVTHNPNIPVLGEAERVFVFSSDGQRSTITQSGTVDECKEQIERILEGGRDAFRERMARYGH